jgi:ubiquinone/menaquinone biosynthesis C-methylase UbiE
MTAKAVHYDQIAPTYDERYATLEYPGVASTLLALARSLGGQFVLEVGCGTGHWLEQLLSVSPQIYGLDLSPGMLREASDALQGRLVCGDAGDLPFARSSFDFIYCVSSFHHFAHQQEFISEAARTLRSGGILAIIGMDPHIDGHDWSLYDYFEGTKEVDLARYPSADTIGGWLLDAGFVQVTCGIAERIERCLSAAEALQSAFLQKEGTSQLTLLTEEAYAEGIRRIKADLLRARAAGRTLEYRVDISLAVVTGRAR